MALHPVDLIIVAAYLAGMLLVGYLLAGRIQAFSDFFVARHGLTTPILIASIVSSYYGLDALFGDSGDASREGVVVWFTYGRPYTLALLLTAVLVARRLRRLDCLSLSDILAHHYGKPAQVAGAVASFFYSLPILSIMGLAAGGEVILGLPMWLGAVTGSAFAVAYTAMGGFWADALTDVAQFLIMSVSLAVAVPVALNAVGGFGGIRERLGAEFFAPLGSAPPLYTLAYALTDSPVGLAAWIMEKFRSWSDCGGDVERRFTKDVLLTNVMLYWVTGAINSSFWPYCARRHQPWPIPDGARIVAPTAYAAFPRDIVRPPRAWAERVYNIRRWTSMPAGGHFAALEEPEALAADIRSFFREFR